MAGQSKTAFKLHKAFSITQALIKLINRRRMLMQYWPLFPSLALPLVRLPSQLGCNLIVSLNHSNPFVSHRMVQIRYQTKAPTYSAVRACFHPNKMLKLATARYFCHQFNCNYLAVRMHKTEGSPRSPPQLLPAKTCFKFLIS